MDFFNNLQDIKILSNDVENQREIKSEELFSQALELMSYFEKSKDKKNLINASELFFESIKYKRNNPDPYLWLAHIFYTLGKNDNAIKYIKLAEMFKSQDPMLNKLKILLQMENPKPKTVVNKNKQVYNQAGGFLNQLKLLKTSIF